MVLSTNKFIGLSDTGKVNVITGLFNPSVVNGKKKFRVNIGYDVKPTEDEQLEFNKESVLAEVVKLGGDLVTSFESK
ncbi:unnamed protein product [Ambrosiozyma monospora]|uniref:Unnamed protein product n=1 Tax=Ambrosiozyma monospora TaxID=43982 RepID=A0A9W6YWV3_AMBMO|nr:unnamed protein product [Ambrosiozyma monospora]